METLVDAAKRELEEETSLKATELDILCISDNIIIGIKNIIGIVVEYNNENLFYSILDDCFFKIVSFNEKLADNKGKYLNKIFDEVYDGDSQYMTPIWKDLYEKTKKEFLTKKEKID